MKIDKLTIKLSMYYIIIFLGMASISPYLILFYQKKGLTFAPVIRKSWKKAGMRLSVQVGKIGSV